MQSQTITHVAEDQKLNEDAKRQPKKIWKKIKSIRKNKTKTCEHLKMEDLLQHFQTVGMLSSHLMQSEIIIYGLVRKCVKLSPFS